MIKVLNLSVIYDEDSIEHTEYYNRLNDKICSLKYDIFDINLFENSIEIDNTDFVLVISDDIKESIKEFDLLSIKKENIPIYIVTGNLNTDNIVECINFTPYLAYIKNSSTKVIQKIINIVKVRKNENK